MLISDRGYLKAKARQGNRVVKTRLYRGVATADENNPESAEEASSDRSPDGIPKDKRLERDSSAKVKETIADIVDKVFVISVIVCLSESCQTTPSKFGKNCESMFVVQKTWWVYPSIIPSDGLVSLLNVTLHRRPVFLPLVVVKAWTLLRLAHPPNRSLA